MANPSVRVLRAFGSMYLAMMLLGLAMVLVYAGTWAQIDTATFEVQQRYFHAWMTWIPFGVMLPRTAEGLMVIPGGIVFPGGYTLGLLMLVNLAANWFTRFRWGWKQLGIHLIHAGLVLLLVGEAWTSVAQVETQMVLGPGEIKSYASSVREWELAVNDRTPGKHDAVYAVSQKRLRSGEVIREAAFPLELQVEEYATNSELWGPEDAGIQRNPKATAGLGVGITMAPRRPTSGVQGGMANVPSAYVSVREAGKPLGTYLLSGWSSPSMPLDGPQLVKLSDGREYFLQLRPKRETLPFSLTLIEFRQDRYAGTGMARNFQSRVRLVDRERGIDREERIWMNHPLRYRGETFYQASFAGEDTTVLQVVRNPAVWVPYVACGVGAVGLLVQFGIGLAAFLRRREERAGESRATVLAATPVGVASWVLPLSLVVLAGVCLIVVGVKSVVSEDDLAQAPVFFSGRLQPLDSVARNTLRIVNGSSDGKRADGSALPAMGWLMDTLCQRPESEKYPIVRIDNPDILATMGLDGSRNRFAPAEVAEKLPRIVPEIRDAVQTPAGQRDAKQRKLVELQGKVNAYAMAADWAGLYLVPPAAGESDWRPLGEVWQQAEKSNVTPEPLVMAMLGTFKAYQEKPEVGPAARQWLTAMRQQRPDEMARMRWEVFYNRYQPFLVTLGLYGVVFLLACASMLAWRGTLWRSAMAVGVVALLLHTAAIAMRVYLQGRPPVTNLYSSAIFIGWGAVLLALAVEWIYRNGITLAMSTLVGTATLVIAQNLAQGGDTMASLQAVLDSNFWLTTHVLAITYGYSAVFVAGGIGIAYVVLGLVNREVFERHAASLSRMIYGTVCFAMVFSFVGTLLGGIWADQSWGRFWGWDPKENGAVLIVLWLAMMLHAKGVGARGRGLALMAVLGNVVTAWSWFGTNMLGVGLHSYGFMDSALMWLLIFSGSQVVLAGLGGLLVRPVEEVTAGREVVEAAVR